MEKLQKQTRLEIYCSYTFGQSITQDRISTSGIVCEVSSDNSTLTLSPSLNDKILNLGIFDSTTELYTIVRLSELGWRGGEVLGIIYQEYVSNVANIVELEDESFEIIVRKAYLHILQEKLYKIFPGSKIDSNYNPTEPSLEEVQRLTYTRAKALKQISFSKRAQAMIDCAWPRAAAYYSSLVVFGGQVWQLSRL